MTEGIVEAVTGKDLATRDELSGFDRATGALVVLRWLKTGKKALDGDDVRTARNGTCAAQASPTTASRPGPGSSWATEAARRSSTCTRATRCWPPIPRPASPGPSR
ncbi:pre-toxin TG domain-containing protein [Streptomyces swartbergensis]|uniref:Pre-toxin TG domain-containing protein n=1 Tax=Streptomyces swartbergensis TaxID=487165 RepID=A0A243S121_9ACTN|nr:hypothetical protein CA983_21285 [Streptomyces swartbergensis]